MPGQNIGSAVHGEMAAGLGLSATLKSINSCEVTQPNQFVDKLSKLAEKSKQMRKRELKLRRSFCKTISRKESNPAEWKLFRRAQRSWAVTEVSTKECSVFTTAVSCTRSISDSWNAKSLWNWNSSNKKRNYQRNEGGEWQRQYHRREEMAPTANLRQVRRRRAGMGLRSKNQAG